MVSRAQTAETASKEPSSSAAAHNPVVTAPTSAPSWALDICGPGGGSSPHGYGDTDTTGALLQQFGGAPDAEMSGVTGATSSQAAAHQLQNAHHVSTSDSHADGHSHVGHDHPLHADSAHVLSNHAGGAGGQDHVHDGAHSSGTRSLSAAVDGHHIDHQTAQSSGHGDLSHNPDSHSEHQAGQHQQIGHDPLAQHSRPGQLQPPEHRSSDPHSMGYDGLAHNQLVLNQKKVSRLPGTKVCPQCDSTIAAALAKCSKCTHVFREKKEKVKRSGKRGKKTCPKCGHENPSACSSCKGCSHVFRLKLMDKYRHLRAGRDSNGQDAGGRVNMQQQLQHVGNNGNAGIMGVGGLGSSPGHNAGAMGFMSHSTGSHGHNLAQSQPQHLSVLSSHPGNVGIPSMSSHQVGHNGLPVPPPLDAITAAASQHQSVMHHASGHHQQQQPSQQIHLQQHQHLPSGVPVHGEPSHAESSSIVSTDGRGV